MRKRTHSELRPFILALLQEKQMTVRELSDALHYDHKAIGVMCHNMQQDRQIVRAGYIYAPTGKKRRVALWTLPGMAVSEDREDEILPPVRQEPLIERAPLPDTLTGLLCGDPGPGRSALDQRRMAL